MWHPFIRFLLSSLQPRGPTQPGDAFLDCVSQKETVKKEERREPCGGLRTHLKVFENRSICLGQRSSQLGNREGMGGMREKKKNPQTDNLSHRISWSVVQLEADGRQSSGPAARSS